MPSPRPNSPDTVLVAATGYGKSAVLYAFAAITGTITIQIVPLTQLGLAQLEDITRDVTGSSPVFVDADTQLKAGKYSHVLLSPEQALNPQFKAILRSPGFHSRIGLFAIDELHVVQEWRDFRADFTYLHTLRSLLPQFILEHAGFDGTSLKVIRTSVDRPDISVVVQPLLRGFIRDHRRLEFLLENADPANSESLEKTIIYVDSKAMLQAVRHHLIQYLVKQKGFALPEAKDSVVRYDADVRAADKERIYAGFSQRGSRSRVAVVTIAFGMGLHIPDVRIVVQYGLPIEPSVTDLWQRLGRAMRKIPGQGTAYIFAPYWLFDHLGTDDKPAPPPTRGRRQAHRPIVPSRLREVALVEADSNNIDAGAMSEPKALNPNIRGFFNAICFRRQALTYLQEPDDPNLEYKRPVPPGLCCNRCNSDLGPVPPLSPRSNTTEEKPQANSFAAVALSRISDWCAAQAQSLAVDVRFDIVGEMFMGSRLQYAIARQYSSGKDLDGLLRAVPTLKEWRYLDTKGVELAKMCFDVFPDLVTEWNAIRAQRAAKRTRNRAAVTSRIDIRPDERVRGAGDAETPQRHRNGDGT
ncbi:P-loop containing nucleoside triphosphate hydrolase protein [Xylaria intraflava]|nr:P-loop containing nucleoside triphosphate hydrolase protein [Xylaria intraflava]